jgi:hypothetical protein
MTPRRDDLAGIDDCLAERALARRARHREVGEGALCGGRFAPHLPTQFDALGYLMNDICACAFGRSVTTMAAGASTASNAWSIGLTFTDRPQNGIKGRVV